MGSASHIKSLSLCLSRMFGIGVGGYSVTLEECDIGWHGILMIDARKSTTDIVKSIMIITRCVNATGVALGHSNLTDLSPPVHEINRT